MHAQTLQERLELACKIAKSYFDRGMGSGTTGNLSFMMDGKIYITASGTCFGFLTPEDFAVVPHEPTAVPTSKSDGVTAAVPTSNSNGVIEAVPTSNSSGVTAPVPQKNAAASVLKPSKELPLHEMVYDKLLAKGISDGAVIHTHSTYSVLWSCLADLNPEDCVPEHTPYLRMKMGACGLISYHKPGSPELFDAFRKESGDKTGWLLSHHGLLVGGKTLMDAFGKSEELEESCKVAWLLRGAGC